MGIRVKKAEVEISEQTLRELLEEVGKAKEKLAPFCDEPMPDCDMSVEMADKEWSKRGVVVISSPYSSITYRIVVDNTLQESLGYKAQL